MAAARKIPKKATPVPKGRKQHVAERGQATVTPPQETPAPSTILSSKPRSCVIVGIGASAGGLQAMQEFFRHTPPSSGMAFVVVSHQHAGHVSLLPSLLGTCTTMRVAEATDGMEVEPNQVYVAPGGSSLAILHGTLQFMEAASLGRVPLPIDYFFRSLAEDQQQRAVGIIFSGTGTDGTLGLRAIKAESGLTIAQEPQSATYQGMPRNAIAAGVVDVVKPADQMSEPLLAYARSLTRPVLPILESDASQTLRKVFILLRDRTGNDFTLYKENTIHRRIERRMNVHQLDNLKQYLRFVLANPHELDALFRELLIGVTSFFRDPEAFEALAQ
ncbi:MAG: chemotaxis protein CheB, partial [Nitrospira sp.]